MLYVYYVAHLGVGSLKVQLKTIIILNKIIVVVASGWYNTNYSKQIKTLKKNIKKIENVRSKENN
jgi:hypothetical protein